MTQVWIICEGQTEERFVKDLLAPSLRPGGVFAKPLLMSTSSAKGGAVTIERFTSNAVKLLKGGRGEVVTCLIDLYALDTEFPHFQKAMRKTDLFEKLAVLEKALHEHVVAEAGCRPNLFIPHIQPHEFEGLLFSDVEALTGLEEGWRSAHRKLDDARNAFDSPEHVNDGRNTAPSKRLEAALHAPTYKKTSHGPRAAKAITLAVIERECVHFHRWLDRLRALS